VFAEEPENTYGATVRLALLLLLLLAISCSLRSARTCNSLFYEEAAFLESRL
jgi:hypothetical protein